MFTVDLKLVTGTSNVKRTLSQGYVGVLAPQAPHHSLNGYKPSGRTTSQERKMPNGVRTDEKRHVRVLVPFNSFPFGLMDKWVPGEPLVNLKCGSTDFISHM